MEVLTDIPCELNIDAVKKQAGISAGTPFEEEFDGFLEKVLPFGKPKAIYDVRFIDNRGEDTVTIDGTVFTSKVLRANLKDAERVFPYIATCGMEFDEYADVSSDILKQYWLDAIKAGALSVAVKFMLQHMNIKYKPGKTAAMHPGSGDADVWPIEQQKELFELFGDVENLIGVQLTESFLMHPNKTVSGIHFITEMDYQGCKVCHREVCPNRRTPFDPHMAKELGHRL